MVRLKVTFSHNLFIFLQISIPYGAIKSIQMRKILFLLYLFQFLMVRLKEKMKYIQINLNLISIPYGAIKSMSDTFLILVMLIFQFLMVRLKVIFIFLI